MKPRQKLLLVLISLFLIVCAVFLPSLFWKAHLHYLSGKQEIRAYDLNRTDAVLTPQIILQNLGTFETYPDSQILSEEEEWEEIKTVLQSFTELCDAETQSILDELLNKANLEAYSTNPIIRQGEHGAIYMILVTANMLCPDGKTQVFLYYERKTQMILAMEIISNDEEDLLINTDSLESAIEAYIEQLGLGKNQYQCYVNPHSFFFQMFTDETLYGTPEGDQE